MQVQNKDSRSALERFLGLFTEVRRGEGVTVLLLFSNLFLVLMSYYIAKVLREAWILAEHGAEVKSYLSAGQLLLILLAVRLYAWLAGKFARRRLISTVNIFFSACLVLFYLLAQTGLSLGIIFFLWIGMFNVMVVAQFWSFANDLYTPERGKRLFAIVAFGASIGAVAGSYLPSKFIPVFGLNQLLLVSAGILLISLLITNYVDSRERGIQESTTVKTQPKKEEESFGKEGAFKLLFSNKYLVMIAFLIMLLNWVNTTGEYILSKTVTEAAERLAVQSGPGFSTKDFIGAFYANFFTIVNIAGVVIQLFLVSRILKYLGIRIAIMILPAIALGGYLILAFYPLLNIVRWAKIAENSTDYSLNNTVRHALFLPTTREEKYKAKQAIDSFFHRSGDFLSALVVFAGAKLALETQHFAIFNLVLVAIWLVLAVRIGKQNSRLVGEKEK